jgi:hypothetical protein
MMGQYVMGEFYSSFWIEDNLTDTALLIKKIVEPYWDKLIGHRFGESGFFASIRGHYDIEDGSITVKMNEDGCQIIIVHTNLGNGATAWGYPLADPESIDKIQDRIKRIINKQ